MARRGFKFRPSRASRFKQELDIINDSPLVRYNGKEYEYSRSAGGQERMFIFDPQHEVERDLSQVPLPPPNSIAGRVLRDTDNPDLRRSMLAIRAARLEARQLGLDAVTEGKMKELTAAVQAIKAGVQ